MIYFRDFLAFPNEKYSNIMQNSQNVHSYPLILTPKWPICPQKNSQNGTKRMKSTIPKHLDKPLDYYKW